MSITPNQIPLTTIVTYLQKSYRSRISNHWATIPACSVVPPIYKSPRKHTVTYHFSDLQEVYSGNRQIHTKCQLQYFHPPHISTSGKCHCVIIHQTTKATEYTHTHTHTERERERAREREREREIMVCITAV